MLDDIPSKIGTLAVGTIIFSTLYSITSVVSYGLCYGLIRAFPSHLTEHPAEIELEAERESTGPKQALHADEPESQKVDILGKQKSVEKPIPEHARKSERAGVKGAETKREPSPAVDLPSGQKPPKTKKSVQEENEQPVPKSPTWADKAKTKIVGAAPHKAKPAKKPMLIKQPPSPKPETAKPEIQPHIKEVARPLPRPAPPQEVGKKEATVRRAPGLFRKREEQAKDPAAAAGSRQLAAPRYFSPLKKGEMADTRDEQSPSEDSGNTPRKLGVLLCVSLASLLSMLL